MENENRLLKQRLEQFQTHRHVIGGYIGTGFIMADIGAGRLVAVPFALSGEEMTRNKKSGPPTND